MREPTRTVHRTADGTPVFSYVPGAAADHPAAYAVEVIGPGAVPSILKDLSGWTVSGSTELAAQLVAAGAIVRRHFHFLRRSLASDRPPPAWSASDLGPGRREVPCDREAGALFDAWHAAYSDPENPDRHLGSNDELLAERLIPLLSGTEGPVLPWSRLVVDPDDRVVAGVIAIENGALGPWLADVFRSPGPNYAGLGEALLRRVLAAAARADVREVGLSVTDGNPARAVYQRLGFETVSSFVSLDVP
ncbi:MAG TPA: GNAT family N-acetyltransferase [Kineosporiaceae bacterium]|nr:GNAT family N-acetyltransferase [Kineosporiaceae bacterium]